MTRDRLEEFRAKSEAYRQIRLAGSNHGDDGGLAGINGERGEVSYALTDGEGSVSIDMELVEGQDELARHFKQLEDLRKLIKNLKEDIKNVKTHHYEILFLCPFDEKQKQELNIYKSKLSTMKSSSKVIRTKLKDMEKDIQGEMGGLSDQEPAPALLRIKNNQHSYLLRDFLDAMNAFQSAQIEYRDQSIGKIKRQAAITDVNLTDEQVDRMIEEGNFSVFTQNILMDTKQVHQMLADSEERHTEMLKVEKSLQELHDLFLEIALLIESQGEVVGRIEHQVLATKEYTESAQEKLKDAEVMQTGARKKQIWIIIFLTAIAILLLLIIYFSL